MTGSERAADALACDLTSSTTRKEGPYAEGSSGPFAADPELRLVDSPSASSRPTTNCTSAAPVHPRASASRGRHNARPWQGDNAIHRAGALLARLAATSRVGARGLTYRTVTSATLASGRRGRNACPTSS